MPGEQVSLVHVVNPVVPPAGSDLDVAQPVTFEAMRRAAAFARDAGIDVELVAANYPEDDEMVPSGFVRVPHLTRSVLDVGEFEQQRKLPLVADLIERAHDVSDAEWLVFSNVDIAPMPYFYETVVDLLARGNDALAINRRTVPVAELGAVPPIGLLYAEYGRPHPGFDCFVFPRRWVPDLDIGEVCVGGGLMGMALLMSLWSCASSPRVIHGPHLTFHIGDEGPRRHAGHPEFGVWNASQMGASADRLEVSDPTILDRLPGNVRAHARAGRGERPLRQVGRGTRLRKLLGRVRRALQAARRELWPPNSSALFE